MIILLSIGIMNHVFIIPVLLQTSGRDAWISVLISIIPLMLVTGMTHYVARQMKDKSIHEWLEDNYGLVLTVLFKVMMSIFLYLICFYTLFDTTNWAKITFLTDTPIIVSMIVLLGLCLYAAIAGFKPIAISAGILLPFVVLLGFFIMTVNFQSKDYSQLLPILSKGWGPVWNGVLNSCAGSFEIIIYLFMQPKLAKPAKAWQLYVLSLALIGLTMGPLIGAITIFDPYEAARQRYPAYEEWRVATIGRYISQTDFFSIYQWLSGAFIRVSLSLYLMVDIWNIKKKLHRNISYAVVACLVLLISVFGPGDIRFLKILKIIYFPISALFLATLILILFILACISSRKKVQNKHGP